MALGTTVEYTPLERVGEIVGVSAPTPDQAEAAVRSQQRSCLGGGGAHDQTVPRLRRDHSVEAATSSVPVLEGGDLDVDSVAAGDLRGVPRASRFDEIAPIYDETRGGEARGDEYAADIDRLLPREPGTLLETGVGRYG